jgi:hypothetical protein
VRLGLLTLFVLTACLPISGAPSGGADPNACDPFFDDHTHVGAIDVETFARMAETLPDENPQQLDFIVVYVGDAGRRHVRFEDGQFYRFHDEWYWFRLMNGVTACGSSQTPDTTARFATIGAIKRSLLGKDSLPLDLERVDSDRIYSPGFYALSLHVSPRVYATGTLFRYTGGADRWAFELEYFDAVTSADLHVLHSALEATLPANGKLFWRAVSPAQGELAAAIENNPADALRGRTLRVAGTPPSP